MSLQIDEKEWERIVDVNRFSAAGEIDAEYLTPMEDIFEMVEFYITRPLFGLSYNYIEGKHVLTCQTCGEYKTFAEFGKRFEEGKSFSHKNTCDIYCLKDLIATLGDMIS